MHIEVKYDKDKLHDALVEKSHDVGRYLLNEVRNNIIKMDVVDTGNMLERLKLVKSSDGLWEVGFVPGKIPELVWWQEFGIGRKAGSPPLAEPMEIHTKGRVAGEYRKFFPYYNKKTNTIEPLEKWVRHKFKSTKSGWLVVKSLKGRRKREVSTTSKAGEAEIKRLTYLIARKIGNEGFEAKYFFRKAIIKTIAEFSK